MTQWKIDSEYRTNAAYLWMREWLETFDLSKLDQVRLDHGRYPDRHPSILYGRCWWPRKLVPGMSSGGRTYGSHKAHGYVISCQVIGPEPVKMTQRASPVYRNADGTWPPIPEGYVENGWAMDGRNGRQWIRLIRNITLTIDEAIVAIVAHEGFHFLRHSRQIGGKNFETVADRFMLAKVEEWRAHVAD